MAEHKRHHVQVFAYDEELHELRDFKSSGTFLDFLHHSSSKPIPLSSTPEIHDWSLKTFFKAANTIAQSIKNEHFSTSDTLVFRSTGDKSLSGHVTDPECMPDFIAAFNEYFENEAMLWPYIRLTGEHASKGKTRKDQEKQAISYLHYLLLARPDLYVAQGMLTSKTGITFLVGIGGHGVRSLLVDWSNKELSKLMYAFIFCLYRPDKFADPSFEIGHVKDGQVTYTIKLPIKPGVDEVPTDQQVVIFREFLPIYAGSPFETRTHVFSNTDSEVTINNKRLTVLKDQFCREGTRFNEYDILKHVHAEEKVPGVVQAVYNDIIAPPDVDEPIVKKKHRIGMGQYGDPFMTIPNVKAMLEVAFDILEGTVVTLDDFVCAHGLGSVKVPPNATQRPPSRYQ
ncbi:hypothetical protein FRC01_005237 [Tulasnella sp. 417]|nr:hypothetical protein FRC01_005237 [Tulasnella sp. 417]